MADTILTRMDTKGVATLTLNRPDIHNAFDDVVIEEMAAALRHIEAQSEVRVLVITGSGSSFSAGADLNWMRRMAEYSREQNLADAMQLAELMKLLDGLHKPLIARVQGPAFGGGVGLVACADIAIAADCAAFALTEARLGLVPAVISPYVVNAIGERNARRYFVTGERFDPNEARRIGLVHTVVAPADLDDAVATVVAEILRCGPEAMVAAKQLARFVSRSPIDTALIRGTAEIIAERRSSAEGREGVAAFLAKRKPAWQRS